MPQWSLWIRALIAAFVLDLHGAFGLGSDEHSPGPAYTVSQTHSLQVREDGLIDVVLSIVFNVAEGTVLPGSSKTILSDFGVQSIVGTVVATSSGRSLPPVRTSSDSKGWFKVDFDFAEPVHGSVTQHYTVDLAYTVSNGICVPSSGRSRFGLSWAHLWNVPVLSSRYEITFANTQMDMGTVCIGASGFRLRCGPPDLTVPKLDSTKALHRVSGALHDAFFEWPSATTASTRPCLEIGTGSGPTLSPPASKTLAAPEEDPPMAATTLGLAAVGSSLLVGGAVCALANRARRDRQRERECEREAEENNLPGKNKLSELMEIGDKVDLEEGASDSTVPSTTESPTFASRRFAEQPNLRQASPAGTPERLRQASNRSLASPAGKLNWNLRGSPQRADTGAGLGAWDVPEEFLDKELAYLSKNSNPEYSVHVSEHSPASSRIERAVYGKPDRGSAGGSSPSSSGRVTRQQAAEMDSSPPIQLHVVDKSKASDPVAVEADCDDLPVEDDIIRSSVIQPKDLFASGSLATTMVQLPPVLNWSPGGQQVSQNSPSRSSLEEPDCIIDWQSRALPATPPPAQVAARHQDPLIVLL